MSFKRAIIGIIIVLLLAVVPFLFTKVTHAQEQSQGGASVDMSGVLSKLDQVLNNQRAIMDQIAALREEMRIIKIRVTQAQ